MPITYTEASQLITAAEHSLPFDAAFAGESDPTTCVLGIALNVSDLALGDEVLLKVYETIDGEQLPIHEVSIAGPHSARHVVLPDMIVTAGWNATLRWISGTERTISWRLKVATGDTTAAIADAIWDEAFADHVAAGSFGAFVGALPSAAAVASAVFAFAYEGALAFGDLVKDVRAVIAGDAADLTTAPKYKDSTGANRVSFTMGGSGATRTRS